ncbi:hypothetical protein OESDEN_01402 [Oesophagostomum dentatum]|uniref:Conserved oligomeric Golgi complex subunit 7 n=1 Tax=Oesophagostomum dentatum TaxID=61180 RepID=A0A0B1TM50_OESDE|nr:hypothetical protein OESDEN_01402 [Oesophagostomum dentatum]
MAWETNEVRTQPPTVVLSSLCEGFSHEERHKKLGSHYAEIQKQCDDTFAGLEKAKSSIDEARVKYENMNEMIRTLEQLRCSLEQHIRMVRLNENSFGGTSSVLEFDSAKTRTNNLISIIKARSQWNRAMEYLKEEGRDDQQKMYECLADMQTSQETLTNVCTFLSNGFDTKEFEDVKDRFLAWQSAALIFAIQQADFEKLAEIQHTYESLGRKDEFISIFRRVSTNRLREFSAEGSTVQLIIDALYKELEFVFTHHHKVLRRFLDDDAASKVLSEAIQEGLKELDLTESFSHIISGDENPIDLLQKVSQFLTARADSSAKVAYLANISQHLKTKVVHDLAVPFRSALLSYVLSKVNTVDLNSGSFRARVESLKTAVAELLHLLTDVFVHSEALFTRDVKNVVQQPIDKGLENFLAKLKSWEYWLDSQRRPRSLEDIIAVCSASGQLVFGLQEFKTMVTNVEPSLSPNIKSALKWNRGVCDVVLKTAIDNVVVKMKSKMEEIKSSMSKESRVSNLPAFSTSPHEYITTVGQELLQLFHLWEQFFLDDNVVHSFYTALKKKFEGDELFKKTVSDVANSVITEFVAAVGDPSTYSREVAKQFHADTVFLKDAFEDLRTGNVDQLTTLEATLRSRYAT